MEILILDFVQFYCTITKFYLWNGEWAVGHFYTQFCNFPEISSSPKILSFKSLANS